MPCPPQRNRLALILGLVALLAPGAARAVGTCTWSGGAGDNKWSTAGNWTAGGGAICPPTSSAAQFTGGAINCNIDVNATPSSISIAGYNGIVTQLSGRTVTISGGFTQSTGTFVGGNSAIDMSGSFTFSGGTFKVTSDRMAIGGQFNVTGGTFTAHPAGTYVGRILLKSTTNQTFASNGISFNDLYLNDGLAGYWKLDDTSSPAADASGYGNTLTWTNSVASSASVPTLNFTDPKSALFNMTTRDALLTSMPTSLQLAAPITLTAWYKATTMSSNGGEIVSGADSYVVRLTPSGIDCVKYKGSSSWVTLSSTPSNYKNGAWHHVACVISASAMTIYFDGSSVASNADASAIVYPAPYATLNFAIGRHGGTNTNVDYNGNIDEVRVYSRALSASDITSLYLGGQPQTYVALQTMTGSPTVTGDLTIASGGLAVGANTLSVAGNLWTYGGTFSGGTGTVTFNGSASGKSILVNGSSFNNLTVSGTGAWSIADTGQTVTVGGNLALSAGTLTSTSGVLKVGGAFNNSGGTFTHNSGTVMLISTSSKSGSRNL